MSRVKVLAANTHVGEAVSPGFAAQVHVLQPDIILMSEVVLGSFEELHQLFTNKYFIAPGPEHQEGREATQTPVLLLRERFKLLAQSNEQISPWRGGGEHGRLWPTRFATQVKAHDMESDRIVSARAVHTWALGPNPPVDVVTEHQHQVDHVAAWAKPKPTSRVVFAGGDWNENLDSPHPTYAVRQMTEVGMKRAGSGQPAAAHTSLHAPAYLDDVFYKGSGVRLADYAIKRNAGPGADHMMVLATFTVSPA